MQKMCAEMRIIMNKHIDDNCIFCKLANAIILPKTHAANLFELPDEYGEKIFAIAKKCGKAIKETYDYDGLNVLQNNGEAAGQTVFHLHVHLIPRMKDDNIDIKWAQGECADGEKIAEKIKANLTD